MHVAVLSTEHVLQQGSAQHAWLEGDLAAVRREDTPWLLVAGHRPLYVDADDAGEPGGKQAGAALLRGAIEDLLERHGVDVALSGHHHSYQRSCPVFQGVCQEPKGAAEADAKRRRHGTVHVCFGNGGAELYHNQMPQRPRWAAFEEVTKHGHVRIHADAERFQLQAIEAKTGEVFDEVVLTRKKDGAEADVHPPGHGVQEPVNAGFSKSEWGRWAATF
ncbi:hypothetical protein H632_c1346p1 [Helicosporidium sp. ATCC 50920]|nr:hypothetical protein H632_c1346p1 [Helicosporidium sp. ATCC 50920]|eukprot:KDD74393.1 hypothetical protein H632_c1346p1 [Helicosporidium sp. ATCC 50920]